MRDARFRRTVARDTCTTGGENGCNPQRNRVSQMTTSAEVLELIKDSDSVELKLTIPETEHSSTVAALGIDPLDAQIRQVFFFDTPDLTLYEQGVVVRARRVQKKGDDSVVKLRPVVPSQLPSGVRRLPEFGVEVDAMPGGFVCSGSLKGIPKADVRETVMGGGRTQKLFSKEQRAFYAEHAPEGLALDDLSVLGPIFVLKLKFAPMAFDRRLVAEMWLYPDGSRILELSTKCAPGRGVPGRRGDAGVPHGAGRGSRRRAGDEDPQGARLLLRATEGRELGPPLTQADDRPSPDCSVR